MYWVIIKQDAKTVKRFKKAPNPGQLGKIEDSKSIIVRIDEIAQEAFTLHPDGSDDSSCGWGELVTELGSEFKSVPQGRGFTALEPDDTE